MLLRYGADPNVRDADGITPLHSASHNGKFESVLLLLHFEGEGEAQENATTSLPTSRQGSTPPQHNKCDAATVAKVIRPARVREPVSKVTDLSLCLTTVTVHSETHGSGCAGPVGRYAYVVPPEPFFYVECLTLCAVV